MRKYVNSGKFNIVPVLLWTLLALVAGGLISVGYTFIAHYVPSIWLNLGALMGMAVVLAWAVVFCVKQSKSRNKAVNVVMALVVSLFAWYVSWCTILSVTYETSFFWLLVRPGGVVFPVMFDYMNQMQWTFNDSNVSPLMAKFSYLIELLAFLAPAFLVAAKKLYYCEFCEGFMKPKDHYFIETGLVGEHLDAIKAGDLSFMEKAETKLGKASKEVPEQYKLNLHTCPGCQEKVYNFYHVRMKLKKGKYEPDNTTALVENIYACRPEEQ